MDKLNLAYYLDFELDSLDKEQYSKKVLKTQKHVWLQ